MNVRPAKIQDAKAINALINEYAEQDMMLFRPLADIYENLRSFHIAEVDDRVVGCCALHIIWQDLAEIKSLAVDKSKKGTGIGKALVEASLTHAKELGLPRVFALTLEPAFFQKLGFEKVDRDELPMKVWSDCARCPKQDHCDETALIKNL
jgi:amino-acid N-acetyltransferase